MVLLLPYPLFPNMIMATKHFTTRPMHLTTQYLPLIYPCLTTSIFTPLLKSSITFFSPMFPEAATDDVGVPTAGGVEVVGLILLVATAAVSHVCTCT